MTKRKIYDCITFYDENLLTNLRFEILKNVVDTFVVCESVFDHKRKKKEINFNLINQEFKNKVKHLIIKEPFPPNLSNWQIEEFQREKLLEVIKEANSEDFIMYSDSDEIPNPEIFKNFHLEKKYGIFLQNFYVYNMDTFNQYETPWEGTRICKKKDLKSITYLRKKIKKSNLKKPFWKIYISKDIQCFNDGGWHFNNFYNAEKISLKLKTFQHKEFASERFSNVDVIKRKIINLEDLFERGNKYRKVGINENLPDYLIKNYNKIKEKIGL